MVYQTVNLCMNSTNGCNKPDLIISYLINRQKEDIENWRPIYLVTETSTLFLKEFLNSESICGLGTRLAFVAFVNYVVYK